MRERQRGERVSKYYPAMRFDINQAQALVNILTMELNLPSVRVKYFQFLNGCNGIYKEYESEIHIQKDRAKLSTLLHEVAHHLQCKGYGFNYIGETVHGATFQKSLRKIIRTFKIAYDDPNYDYFTRGKK